MISQLIENEEIKEKYLISNVVKGVSNAGSNYLKVTLQDVSGQIEGHKWEVNEKDNDIFVIGKVIEIQAKVLKYRNALQLKISSARSLDESEYSVYDYATSSSVPQEKLLRKLTRYVSEIDDKEIKKVIDEFLSNDFASFRVFPAASRNHHEYISGLLEHTVGILDAANGLLEVYPSLNRSYLFGGIILHDLGKLDELSGPIATHYTTEGRLIGHISIMSARIVETCHRLNISQETTIVLQHLVLSHHGEKEFGSPVTPMIREAEVLATLDNLDARINMIDKALKDIPEGEFSLRIMALEGRSFYKPRTKKD